MKVESTQPTQHICVSSRIMHRSAYVSIGLHASAYVYSAYSHICVSSRIMQICRFASYISIFECFYREAVRYSRESQGQVPGHQRSWTRPEAAPRSAPASQPDSDGQGDIDRQAEGSSGNHDTDLLTFENTSENPSENKSSQPNLNTSSLA
jgi:hypothetical protein